MIAIVLTAAMLVGAAAAATSASAAPSQTSAVEGLTTPVTGQNGTTSFDGTFTATGFEERAGQIVALGNVTGTATDNATGTTQQVSQAVSAPVTNAATTAGCDILSLVLGPLHLDVLGLVVDLNQVILNITAVGGLGNLLGNLLCGVTNLLDVLGVAQLLAILNALFGL
ncbi:hypothetical protein BL253_18290 [Pseudofrankia asymbiotica]|uniref:ABC transporter substrate-binding protein n=2 Tax=Pseudofrankia asymbiotica TaxID=1834516 RepID=A0A1V2I9C7_9ACTN|nr:hypothetical protein BL253_18290 [Pseudofrankia asymbiotica]